MAELHVQSEKAFQRQPKIFLGNKLDLLKKKFSTLSEDEKRKVRFWRDVGLGIETPKEAINGEFVDQKCPFTGDVSIRGRILRGVVKHKKMKRTITVRREYLKYIPKFNRYERRHKNISAHCSPAFPTLKEGDQVVIGECRPLAKTVKFNVLQVIENKNRKMFIDA
mmetsp:Transcript_9120/g.33656  ORF Transcript_9120/g.33656 Transcript_9120/m.33656 type:complete len:166 (-) Transcript_9120:123-620(-)|eukprot:CAMPEP_0117439588 /NCGR_PEP_ID=MMETSP0759-20121206/2641_1 /TAXON_ID=63605 /ORGANISM="Percolomonas cosmopolitus, Strain WS" /LENGTH=165 /DNA_ID=CAMNT_0005231305 /DNA_START=42 /DNA_END=539 /DNA_ORIENTATION=+